MKCRILLLFVLLGLEVCSLSFAVDSIPVTKFGCRADAAFDNGPPLQKAFDYAVAHPGTILSFPRGVYRVQTLQQPKLTPHPAFFHLAGADRLILDGQGSEIVFGAYAAGFVFDNCAGITIRDLAFDYDPPIFSQGDVLTVGRDDKSLVLRPSAGFPALDSPIFKKRFGSWITVHKPNGDLAWSIAAVINDCQRISPDGKFRVVHNNPGIGLSLTGQSNLRYVRVARQAGMLLRFNICKDITLSKVRVYSASGFVVLACFSENLTVVDSYIGRRPGSDRMISTNADGIHTIGCYGQIRIENNTFDWLQDDNVAITLRGNRIRRLIGNRQLVLAPMTCTYYRSGDTLQIVDFNAYSKTNYKIVGVQTKGKFPSCEYTLTLDRPLQNKILLAADDKGVIPPHLVFNITMIGKAVVWHNRFGDNRARAVLVATSQVTVEDNSIAKAAFPPILALCIARAPNYLFLYPGDDIQILRNSITGGMNHGGRTGNKGAIDFSILGMEHLRDMRPGKLFNRLVIKDNILSDCGMAGIRVAYADTVSISGNRIVRPNRLLPADQQPRCAIWLDQVTNVKLHDNFVSGDPAAELVHVTP